MIKIASLFLLVSALCAFDAHGMGRLRPCPKARFTMQENAIMGPNFPANIKEYKIVLVNPAISKAARDRLNSEKGDRIFLAYAGVTDSNLWQGWDSPYIKKAETYISKKEMVTDLASGTPKIIWPSPPLTHIVLTQKTADAFVRFYSEITKGDGWDGLYIDQHYGTPPLSYRVRSEIDTKAIDIDGDGFKDTWGKWLENYATWRPYFSEQIRKAWPKSIILTNSDIGLQDKNYNGITIEGIGVSRTVAEAMAAFRTQFALANDNGISPLLGIGWATIPESEEPTNQVCHMQPQVYYGGF